MLKTAKQRLMLELYQSTNLLIYFLRRLPILKKVLPDRLHRQEEFKAVFGFYYVLQKLAIGLVSTGIYAALLMMFGSMAQNDQPMTAVMLYGMVLYSYGCSPFLSARIYHENQACFVLIKVFRMEAKAYALHNALVEQLIDVLFLLPMVVLITLFGGYSPWLVPCMAITIYAVKLVGEGATVLFYRARKRPLNAIARVIVAVVWLLLALALYIGGVALDRMPDMTQILCHPVFVLGMTLLGGGAVWLLWRTPTREYSRVLQQVHSVEVRMKAKSTAQANLFKDVQIDEKKLSKLKIDPRKLQNKQGFDYLNALFFERHAHMVRMPMKISLICIGAIAIVLLGGCILLPELLRPIGQQIAQASPYIPIVLYLASTGSSRVVKAMFYNCDHSLLNYRYYRTPQAVLSSFRYRMKALLSFGMPPMIALSAVLTAFGLWAGADPIDVLLIDLQVLSLGMFFTVFHLFLYYLLQPYTQDAKMKNPLFQFINMAVYLASLYTMQFQAPPEIAVAVSITLAVLFVPTALVCVYRLAPKTFCIK